MAAGGVAAGPVTAIEFAAALEPLAPSGRIAVAVSGGADSLALALLANEWARARGGSVFALTVDHRLRPESAGECAAVAAWMGRAGIPHAVLEWAGPRPAAGIQAAARAARYDLMSGWCRARGVRDLLLGHHRDDQAETFLLRLSRGSGPRGLAAMAPVRTAGGLRLLRPLLGTPKARLERTLTARGQRWVRDPSNLSRRFARVRARSVAAALPQLPAAAAARARARAGLDVLTGELLAAAARWDAAGFCRLDPAALADAPPRIAELALARVLAAVGGRGRPPRGDAVARLLARAARGDGGSLAGAVVMRAKAGLTVVRERRNLEVLPLASGEARFWDGRFEVSLAAGAAGVVAALGDAGWRAVKADGTAAWPGRGRPLPPPAVRPTLPALWIDGRPAAVPHLGLDPEYAGFFARFHGDGGTGGFAVVSRPG